MPYVVRGGFGVYTGNRPRKIAQTVQALFRNEATLAQMSLRAKLQARPEVTIAAAVLRDRSKVDDYSEHRRRWTSHATSRRPCCIRPSIISSLPALTAALVLLVARLAAAFAVRRLGLRLGVSDRDGFVVVFIRGPLVIDQHTRTLRILRPHEPRWTV